MNRQMPSEDRYTDAPPDVAEEINASVEIPDDFPSPDELRRELKRSITLRLDPDVYDWFRLPGPGYQTRINAVLRSYMKRWETDKAAVQPIFLGEHSTLHSAGKRSVKVAAKKAIKASIKKASKAPARRKAAKKNFSARLKEAHAKTRKKRTSPA